MTPNPKPTIPTPPRINHYDSANVRVMFDSNIYPVLQKTPQGWFQLTEAQTYMQALGLDEASIVYNGTINTAGAWNTSGVPDEIPVLNNQWDASRFVDIDWFQNPTAIMPDRVKDAIHAITQLVKAPSFYGSTAKPGLPLILDIEGTKTYNSHPNNISDAVLTADRWTDLFWRNRYALGDYAGLYGFGYWAWNVNKYWGEPDEPQMELFAKQERINANLLSGGCCEFYMRAEHQANKHLWYQNVMRAESLLTRYYPGWLPNRIAVISPAYQHSPTIPVPFELWKAQCDYLASRGWNMLVWTDTNTPFTPIKRYLDHVARYCK